MSVVPLDSEDAPYDPRKHGAACHICPLKGNVVVPPKPSYLPTRLVLVGEAPGRKEELRGSPFLGMTGQFLRSLLREVDIDIREAHLSNAALCRSNLDKENEAAAVCCAPRLLKELAALPASAPIVALGKASALSVLGTKSIMHARGFVWTAREVDPTPAVKAWRKAKATGAPKTKELHLKAQIAQGRALLAGRTVFPTIHPAFVLRSDTWRPVLKVDLDRVARWLRGELTRDKLLDNGPYVVVSKRKDVRRELKKLGDTIAVDIETAPSTPGGKDGADPHRNKMLCVGLSDGDHTVVIWPWRGTHAPLVNACFRRVKTIGMHNGYNFDQISLARHGVPFEPVDGKLEDTLVAHHTFASHMPQRLAHVASVFVDAGPWKITFKRGGGEEKGLPPEKLTGEELCRYNCLPGNTRVLLANGGAATLSKIVERRERPLVLAYSKSEGIVARRVIGWSRTRAVEQQWWHVRTAAYPDVRRKLVSTPDHKLKLSRGWVEARYVEPGDELALPERRMSSEQRDALLGSLLGDSSLATSPAWRKRAAWPVAAVVGGHEEAVGLAQAKVRALPDLLSLGALQTRGGSYAGSQPFRRYRTAMRHDVALEFVRLRDRRGVKRLRVETLARLGPIGFAWWFADDGCRAGKCVRLATNGFPSADVRRARAWFARRFGATSIVNDGVLALGRDASVKFCELIAPHLFPCVRYKLPTYRSWPKYAAKRYVSDGQPTFTRVVASGPFKPHGDWWVKHSGAHRRYCLTVEKDHNFFTANGLVANSADARIQARVWLEMQADLESERHVYAVDKENARMCRHMGIAGIGVDTVRRDLLIKRVGEKAERLEHEMRALLRRPNFHPMQLAEVRRALFTTLRAPLSAADPTESGVPSTSSKTLERLKHNPTRAGKFATQLLEWRGAVKIKSTYLVSQVLDKPARGSTVARTHFNWRSYGAASGRYSCRLQSCPRCENLKKWIVGSDVLLASGGHETIGAVVLEARPEGRALIRVEGTGVELEVAGKDLRPVVLETRVREVYVARPGYKLVYFDLSQAELRLAAYLSNDANYIAMCESGDVHTAIAQVLFPEEAELIRTDPKGAGKPFRDVEKNSIFGFQYYADPTTIFTFVQAKGFDMIRMKDVLSMRDLVHEKCTEYFRWVEKNKRFADKHGYYRCPISGRISWLGWHAGYPDVANRPIQKGIASIMNVRLPRIWRALPKGASVVAQIHDAAILEVPDKHVDAVAGREEDGKRIGGLVSEVWAEPVVIPAGAYGSSLRVEDGARSFIMPIDKKVGERWSDFG